MWSGGRGEIGAVHGAGACVYYMRCAIIYSSCRIPTLKMRHLPEGEGEKKKRGGGELREKKDVVHSLEGQDDIDVEAGTSHGIAERQGRGGASQVRL